MQLKKIAIPLLIIALSGVFASTTKAQTETPPEALQTGEVNGVLVNKSPGGSVPESVELMLHIWDKNYNDVEMQHGQSLPDGSFQFIEVDLDPELVYAVMAIYQDTNYFSMTQVPEPGSNTLVFDLPIYETTTDLSAVTIDQSHVLFYFSQGGLEVMEMYFISNSGEYTVADAFTLDDGQTATIKFTLPQDAAVISFNSQDTSRYIQFSGGFADTTPLVPGRGSAQIAVRYVLPYDERLDFTFSPPFAVENVDFLTPQDEGLKFEGDGLNFESTQTAQDGLVFDIYTHESLAAGETIDISITGRPTNVVALMQGESTAPSPQSDTRWEIGLGALALGLALVAAGGWWWRKPQDENEDVEDALLEEADFRDLVAEIIALDEAFQAGEYPEETYQQRRKALLHQGKSLLSEDPPSAV